MPRPEPRWITFTIDGREVRAPESTMLVDAAKYGDVEIPVFCYEPKLGQPVGACRMCLVEIEGIPKLQTGCSTAVKDGMAVNTQTQRVRTAQEAVVEFLLINHPLDCPVCDKGGECPLQDISFGWGGGRSRFIEPKRHFRKPLELSPLIAIDRERCILCYRCVRYSQEVAEDYQLVLEERSSDSFVATFDGHPYVAPFSGNIVELCPVGALTSRPYRFRARPWDIEGAAAVCTLCPAQCNLTLTVRDERVLRVLARDNIEVDDGWLCDKGRFAYQSIHVDERLTRPLVREDGELRPASWERALAAATDGLARARGGVGALAGGQASNEEGLLLGELMRGALGSPHIDSRRGGALPLELTRALSEPALQARVSDLEFAHAVLVLEAEPVDDAPILDLRIRKGVRRNNVALVVAGSRPSSLDPNARLSIRYAPGRGAQFLAALGAALSGGGVDGASGARSGAGVGSPTGVAGARSGADVEGPARAAGADPEAVRALAALLGDAGDEVVVVWPERLCGGPRRELAARSLLDLSARLSLAGRAGAGLLEIPDGANGRGLREAGALPNAGPGLSNPASDLDAGLDSAGIARAAGAGELTALYLLQCDPVRSLSDRGAWLRALERAPTVVAHASLLTEGLRDHATVVFPAETYAEKEGTVVSPDGRLQRLRPAIKRPGHTRPGWQVLVELGARLGHDIDVRTGPQASARLMAAVPFYAGLTLGEIAGKGVAWPRREKLAGAFPAGARGPHAADTPGGPHGADAPHAAPAGAGAGAGAGGDGPRPGTLRLGTFRSIWAAPEVEVSPALRFLHPRQRLEISPVDAGPRHLHHGQHVLVSVAGGPAASPEGAAANGGADRGGADRGGADRGRADGGGADGGEPASGAPHVHATVSLREAVPSGSVFLEEGIPSESANVLGDASGGLLVEVLPAPAGERVPAGVGAGAVPPAPRANDGGSVTDHPVGDEPPGTP